MSLSRVTRLQEWLVGLSFLSTVDFEQVLLARQTGRVIGKPNIRELVALLRCCLPTVISLANMLARMRVNLTAFAQRLATSSTR